MTVKWTALAWLAGIIAAAAGAAENWPVLLGLGAGAWLLALLVSGPRRALWLLGLTLVVAAGLLRYDASLPGSDDGGSGIEGVTAARPVRFAGTIAGQPEERLTTQRFRLDLERVMTPGGSWAAAEGTVLVTTKLFPRVAYGDSLELEGEIEAPPELPGFDYRAYLARQGIEAVSLFPSLNKVAGGGGNDFTRAVIDIRSGLGDALSNSMPEPEAGLARGILLGLRGGIAADLNEDFNRSGISHLVAISGYNVMLLAGFSVSLLSWLLGRRAALVCAIAIVLFYALLVGGAPSVLRATVMAVVVLGAVLAGRPHQSIAALLLAAALLTLWHPLIIDDVAFQLSFAATLGIVLLSSRLEALLGPGVGRVIPAGAAGFLVSHLAVTLAATLAVLPIIALTFDRVSAVTPFTNLLVVPAFPIILAASALTAATASVDAEAGRFAGEVMHMPISYMIEVGRYGASLPGAGMPVGDIGSFEALGMYAVLAGIAFLLWRRSRQEGPTFEAFRVGAPALTALSALPVVAAVWLANLAPAGQELRVTLLDVGQGDAVLIETPAGHRILIDGGPSGAVLMRELAEVLPVQARRLDLIVLTHPQDDHVAGLIPVIERLNVRKVIEGPLPGKSSAYRAWREALVEAGVESEAVVQGRRANLGDGLHLQVISPPAGGITTSADAANENSLVLRLVYGEVTFLLTGDVGNDAEEVLLDSGYDVRSTVLKVAHHGSDGSTSPEFLLAVSPQVAAVSSGQGNPFGHPSPTTRLRLAGIPLARTDVNGRIQFRTDGERLWLRLERGTFELTVAN